MELTLNSKQQEAVECTEGPLLILAGAGSGKTRVLTHRVAYLINRGINPWNILAITFTNKAAQEMRERVDDTTDNNGASVWVSTFHSLCVRILHRYIDLLGYDTNFTIYDTDDQKQVIKRVVKELGLDPKMYREKMIIGKISHAKERMVDAATYVADAGNDFHEANIGKVYLAYEKELKKSNALDFDDLLCKTVELFRKEPEVLRNYQERFKYIMVDEYQDTNMVQFMLIELLANRYKNLCVVGDDDQSIYKFRGADIRNILNFEKYFPDAKVIKLEQNYRSTTPILNAANGVISNNKGRKAKKLWTDKDSSELVKYKEFETGYEEANFVVNDIARHIRLKGADYSDFAILYRTNAQSRLFEEKLVQENMPYKLIGGVNFYSRKEIKDVLAYLKTIDNGSDDVALRRIINVPKRGIGDTSIGRVAEYANYNDLSLWEAMLDIDKITTISRGKYKIKEFVNLILDLKHEVKKEVGVTELIDSVLEKSGYLDDLKQEGTDEAAARIENIDELRNKAVMYDEREEVMIDEMDGHEFPKSLSNFLEEVALIADIDSMDDSDNRVILMTLHGSKGLEFPYVYMTGLEEGIFPSYMSMNSDDEGDIEEERRLAYVGITRAKDYLTITSARSRMLHGQTQFNPRSRFVGEVPADCFEEAPTSRCSMYGGERKPSFMEFGHPYESDGYISGGYGSSRYNKSSGYGNRHSSYDNGYVTAGGHKNSSSKNVSKPYGGSGFVSAADLESLKGSVITTASKEDGLEYGVGDRVSHIKFGEGTVTNIEEGVRDYKVTVEFDSGETKRMLAAFAKLEKI